MMAPPADAGRFASLSGASVVVTGGLGFIGSALVRRLVGLGSEILVIDNSTADTGANPFNLHGVEDRVTVERVDIRDADAMRRLLIGKQYLFNLAAQTSHQGSMQDPMLDLDVNCRAQLGLLEACRAINPDIAIVYASTRQIYGRPEYLPVDERHPVKPVDVNGIDKAAGEAFHLLYHDVYGIRACALRLTNTYGPRMRIRDARQTFVGVWLRALIEGRPFEVWGGDQRRDFTFVDDVVDAFLLAVTTPECAGRVFNIGGAETITLRRLAEMLIAVNEGGRYETRVFPADRKLIDIGDYYGDDALFRQATGWNPGIGLEEGLRRSLAFFRASFRYYV